MGNPGNTNTGGNLFGNMGGNTNQGGGMFNNMASNNTGGGGMFGTNNMGSTNMGNNPVGGNMFGGNTGNNMFGAPSILFILYRQHRNRWWFYVRQHPIEPWQYKSKHGW
jgi:hypothetical protein